MGFSHDQKNNKLNNKQLKHDYRTSKRGREYRKGS